MEGYKIFGKKKYIVLLDIDSNMHGKTYDLYKFYIVEKIGRKNITDVQDLTQTFKDCSKKNQSTIKISIKQTFKSGSKCITFNIFH
jgi:hypothetical protein